MTFTAMRPKSSLENGRETSLWSDVQASSSISAFGLVSSDLYGSFAQVEHKAKGVKKVRFPNFIITHYDHVLANNVDFFEVPKIFDLDSADSHIIPLAVRGIIFLEIVREWERRLRCSPRHDGFSGR